MCVYIGTRCGNLWLDLGWLPGADPASLIFLLKRTGQGERMGQDKNRITYQWLSQAKQTQLGENLNYCPFLNNVVGWRKTKIRNTFASAPFLRLNCSSSFPLSQPSNPPSNMWQGDGVWELWWVQDCSVLLLPPQGDLLLLQGRLGRMLSNLVYRKVSWN